MATIPPTHRAIRRIRGTASVETPLTLELTTEQTLPAGGLGPHDVLVKILAVSLNYRGSFSLLPYVAPFEASIKDLPSSNAGMLRGLARYLGGQIQGGIAGSDASARVVATGSGVTKFSVGDRVQPTFDLANMDGTIAEGAHKALGGDVDGVLREFVVIDDRFLVGVPGYLTDIEAATLGCASLTAFNALAQVQGENKTVLVQGTGGVAMFAAAFAKAKGWRVIITSGKDEKLEAVKGKFGVEGYNYKNKGQAEEVARLTGGKGVDFVVNNRGPGGVPEDVEVLARGGTVSMVGFMDGFDGDWKASVLLGLIWRVARIQGIAVGSKEDFEKQNKFLEEHDVDLSGLIDDKVFTLEQSQEAFDYLYAEKHVGKVIIRVTE
ncbi:hypothetical protein OQA88_13519 [Cercophora sp. LCS_1]